MNEEFGSPRLARLYDALDPDRRDLDPYVGHSRELGARAVIDLGCGTGTLALRLASEGLAVIGIDPAAASLAVARGKPGAHAVRWIEGDCSAMGATRITDQDLVTMTANVAMCLLTDAEFDATLRAAHATLRPGGFVAFETRNPAARAWADWNRATTTRSAHDPIEGPVTSWTELYGVRWPLVDYRTVFRFTDGSITISESTLRYRDRNEIENALTRNGFRCAQFQDAPDRPGREWIVRARRI